MSNTTREAIIEAYLFAMISWDLFTPYKDLEEACIQFNLDSAVIQSLYDTRYPNGRDNHVPRSGYLHLAWEFAQDLHHHHRFRHMLRLPPLSFYVLVGLIKGHPIFQSGSHNAQIPVEVQLAVTLYRMGRYGNAASVEDVAQVAGCSEGSVKNYTDCCLQAIESLHDLFVQPLTDGEKEKEKEWIDNELGFKGTWREGWLMYDGTIVVLYRCPGLQGETYYTRKGNYGFNVQVYSIFKIQGIKLIQLTLF